LTGWTEDVITRVHVESAVIGLSTADQPEVDQPFQEAAEFRGAPRARIPSVHWATYLTPDHVAALDNGWPPIGASGPLATRFVGRDGVVGVFASPSLANASPDGPWRDALNTLRWTEEDELLALGVPPHDEVPDIPISGTPSQLRKPGELDVILSGFRGSFDSVFVDLEFEGALSPTEEDAVRMVLAGLPTVDYHGSHISYAAEPNVSPDRRTMECLLDAHSMTKASLKAILEEVAVQIGAIRALQTMRAEAR
jgi:hypothetical protein